MYDIMSVFNTTNCTLTNGYFMVSFMVYGFYHVKKNWRKNKAARLGTLQLFCL